MEYSFIHLYIALHWHQLQMFKKPRRQEDKIERFPARVNLMEHFFILLFVLHWHQLQLFILLITMTRDKKLL